MNLLIAVFCILAGLVAGFVFDDRLTAILHINTSVICASIFLAHHINRKAK